MYLGAHNHFLSLLSTQSPLQTKYLSNIVVMMSCYVISCDRYVGSQPMMNDVVERDDQYFLDDEIISKSDFILFQDFPTPSVSILYFAELKKREKLASLLERTDVTGIFQSFSKGWSVCFETVVKWEIGPRKFYVSVEIEMN